MFSWPNSWQLAVCSHADTTSYHPLTGVINIFRPPCVYRSEQFSMDIKCKAAQPLWRNTATVLTAGEPPPHNSHYCVWRLWGCCTHKLLQTESQLTNSLRRHKNTATDSSKQHANIPECCGTRKWFWSTCQLFRIFLKKNFSWNALECVEVSVTQ